MSDDEKRLIYLGSFSDGLPTHVILPAAPIRRVEAALDAERQKREREAERARLAVLQAAKSRGRLRRALRACFQRRRPK